jgi:hypothetical protein
VCVAWFVESANGRLVKQLRYLVDPVDVDSTVMHMCVRVQRLCANTGLFNQLMGGW